MVAEWPLDNLPDTRTRHNRNSKPSATSYLRVRRGVDKEDFALNSVPLWDRRRDTSRQSRRGNAIIYSAQRAFPHARLVRVQGAPATFNLSPVKYSITMEQEAFGPAHGAGQARSTFAPVATRFSTAGLRIFRCCQDAPSSM